MTYANSNSSACKKIKISIKNLDEKNLASWKKYDSRRDRMANLKFSNTQYKQTLSTLKSIFQSDMNIYAKANENLHCYSSQEGIFFANAYDATVDSLANLNTIIPNSNYSNEAKFNSMKETIWLWIAGEYMNYYTLDGRKF